MNKILIAEDSPTQAEQLKYILEKNGYGVMVAKDGQEAIEKALLYFPSLVISDIVMPKKDGYELCQELKLNISTCNIPVILLTSLSNSQDVIEGLACGASSFLTKPYNENYLLKHIEDVLLNTNSSSNDSEKVNVEIMVGDQKRVITTDPQQMLSLLVSSYEAAIQRNTELSKSQDELLTMNERLEELVDERTAELSREIVERKKAEEEIKLKNEALQKANAEKDKFFSIIAHDLRSPFNGFIGLTKIMVEEPDEITPDELSKISRRLYDSANNVYSLLNNLLEWALIQKDSTKFSPEKTKLLPIALSNVAIIEERARQKGISVVNHISDELWVYADSKMVNSILRNMLSNAVKFTRKDGTVSLTAKKTENNMIEIGVTDTGTGMSEDKLKKLFTVDQQIRSKGTDGESSTGLGLILCKEFVEENGGQIRVASRDGIGSEFYFTLPCFNEPGANQIEKESSLEKVKKQINSLKILIAEDDENSQMFLKLAVRSFSKEIILANNGFEAVEACKNQPGIDLVLMDIKMPKMDGHEATRQIREFNKALIIIAQTAFAQNEDREEALSHGFNDYISKPINQKMLSGIIEKYFKNE